MDRVRFGRALGFGARQAVKTLVTAVDAATAEDPSARKTGRSVNLDRAGEAYGGANPTAQATPGDGAAKASGQAAMPAGIGTVISPGSGTAPATYKAAFVTARTAAQTQAVQQGVRRGGRRFGEAAWRPFVRLSGVLWLEVSGVFFGIFALLALGYLWKLRGAWHSSAANAAEHRGLMSAAVMLVLFGYFCISSFVRARRLERGR